jgi:pantetheine-phosphate adenylyltransferase
MMSIGFYAGSFDPFTIGHLHIVKTAVNLFDKVIIGIGINEEKKRKYDTDKMKECIEKTLEKENLNNVLVVAYSGLTVDEMKKYNATFLIRGLRNSKDYEVEENLAKINKKLGDVDTIFLRADKYDIVSSTLVNQLKKQNKDYKEFLPDDVYKYVSEN